MMAAAKPKKTKKAGVSKDAVRPLLIELGTEELPPKSLKKLGEAFAKYMYDHLCDSGLIPARAMEYKNFAAPRRLGALFPEVRVRQRDRVSERYGPPVQAAFDDQGRPTKAAIGFANSCGVDLKDIFQEDTDKGRRLVSRIAVKGQVAARLIPGCLEKALKELPIAKRMRWGDLDGEFVRPVHWLVLMHGSQLIKTELLGVKAQTATRGHRFHYPRTIALRTADGYGKLLEQRGYVIPDFSARREKIRRGVERLAARREGVALIDDDLLDEVTGLVEWPQPVLGGFHKDFLKVPQEALITTMRDNQKYFPVTTRRGRLLPYFITVANIKSKNPRKIRAGNERVLRARFADAQFFWDTDRKTRLEDRVEGLKDVVFHNKLGTLYEKVDRLRGLTAIIAKALGGDKVAAERAARLAKADLMSGMVGEFPGLQGTMGRYYARHDGEASEVAAAMAEQYLPRFAGDRLPKTATGQALAIADRLDTIVGIFGIGEIPTGDKDPFGLRRAALGVLRIMIELKLDLDLAALLAGAVRRYEIAFEPGGVVEEVYGFMMERLRAYYQDAGIRPDVFEAVLACRPTRPLDFDRRVRAVMAFCRLPEADSLTTANKRIRNILRQAGGVGEAVADKGTYLREAAEKDLAHRLGEMEIEVRSLFAAGDYENALKRLARLREPVDTFFDDVMVMVDDEALRSRRLRLLNHLSELFLQVADLSKLQG